LSYFDIDAIKVDAYGVNEVRVGSDAMNCL